MKTAKSLEKKRHAIALMSPGMLQAVAAARPELKAFLKGRYTVDCRRLGTGDEELPQLATDEVGADTVIIGFSVPTNLVARGRKGIEIPLGKGGDRQAYGSKIADEKMIKDATKFLAESARITLRALTAQYEPLVDAEEREEIDSLKEVDPEAEAKKVATTVEID